MNKLIGYLVIIIGAVITIISLNLERWKISLPSTIKPYYVIILGIVLVILGIVFVISKGRAQQISEEVPIYEGKRIIGYRRK